VKEQSPANKMKARAWLSRIWACLMFGTALSALHLYGTIGGWWWGLVIFSAIVSGVDHTSRSGALLATSITVTTIEKVMDES
jgi:hypothetical protein